MLLDRKPFIYVWRPFYRFVFDGMVWPFLARVKVLFFAESHAQLRDIEVQLAGIGARLDVLESVPERLLALEHQTSLELQNLQRQIAGFGAEQRAQWAAFEQLYLAVLSDPDRNPAPQTDGSHSSTQGGF